MRKGVPQIGLSFFVNGFFFCLGASAGRPYHIRSIPSFLTHFIFSRFLRRVFQKFFTTAGSRKCGCRLQPDKYEDDMCDVFPPAQRSYVM